MWFEYSESAISGMLVLNILQKKRQLWNMLVLRCLTIAKLQNTNLKFERLKCDLSTQNLEFLGCWYSIFWKKEAIVKHVSILVLNILKKEAIVCWQLQNTNLKFERLKCDLSTQNLNFWENFEKEAIVKHVSTQIVKY